MFWEVCSPKKKTQRCKRQLDNEVLWDACRHFAIGCLPISHVTDRLLAWLGDGCTYSRSPENKIMHAYRVAVALSQKASVVRKFPRNNPRAAHPKVYFTDKALKGINDLEWPGK